MTASSRTRLAGALGTLALGGLLGACATYGHSSYYAADPVYCDYYSDPGDGYSGYTDSDGNRYYYDEYGNYYYYDDSGNCYYYDARDAYYYYYMPSYGYYSSTYYPNYFFGSYYGFYPYWPSYHFHSFYHYYYPTHIGFWWHHRHPHHGGDGGKGGDKGDKGGTPGDGGNATPPAATPPGIIGSRPSRREGFPRFRARSERDALPVAAGSMLDDEQAGVTGLSRESDSSVKRRDDDFLSRPGLPGRFRDVRPREERPETVPFGLPLRRSSSPVMNQGAAPQASPSSPPPRASAPSFSAPRAAPQRASSPSSSSKPSSVSPRSSRPSAERSRPSRGRDRD